MAASTVVEPSLQSFASDAPALAAPRQISPMPQPQSTLPADLQPRPPQSLKSARFAMPAGFDAPPLTGAAALEDERRERERLRADDNASAAPADAAYSLNPAASAMAALRGAPPDLAVSKPADAPTTTALPVDPPHGPIKNTLAAMQIDEPSTNPPSTTTSDDKAPSGASTASTLNNSSVTSQTTASSTNPPPDEISLQSAPSPDRSPSDDVTRTPITAPAASSPVVSRSSTSSSKKHKCPYCETEFTRHHNLKSHLLTHSQEKPYECSTCQAKFRRLHDLKRHTKLHTGERPHTCSKCGRRFARGDALARHNKGPGGCANGRRGSFGDEDGDGNGDDSMDGVVYNDGHRSDSRDEDDVPSRKRRRSEPGAGERRSSLHLAPSSGNGVYRMSSSTYPGTADTANMSRNYSTGSTMMNSPHDASHYPATTAASSYSSQFNGNQTVYGRGNITDSPRHLSPEADSARFAASDPAAFRGRSSSLTSHMQQQQQQYPRPAGRGTPPIPLPPLNHSGPQLPSLDRLTSDSRHNPFASGSPAGVKASLPPYASLPVPDNASTSSGGQRSSSGSMREILSKGSAQPEQAELIEYVRSLEAKVSRLETEVSLLRGPQQPAPSQAQAPQQSQPPPPPPSR